MTWWGEEDNLLSVTHCVTRLRLSFKDEEKIQKTISPLSRGFWVLIQLEINFR
ncbi:PTS transporter subunit EIIB [Streptococcus anginosus]|uniref:PTS transporter subunit EIIB n=1 Tax=Streptococcus anginosus TaxID=1328 RepID=UPI0020D209B2|nr:PTS transporter subunit EIIB [Streptococcus anginosus]